MRVGGAADLGVVGGDDGVGEEEERCSGVGDGGDRGGYGGGGADSVAGGGEAPESLAVVYIRVGDGARIFGVVNVAEVVGARLSLQQVGGEEGGVEESFGVGEEGLLLVGGDGVDGGEGEAEKAVGFVLGEFGGDGLGEFDGLAGYGGATYVDGIAVDVTAGGAAVAVADGPCFAGEDFGGGGFGGVVDIMVGLFICGEFRREDPAG